jgi:hypothetical protein
MDNEPKVGIFWLGSGKLIIDVTPVSSAETYGECLGHAKGHFEYWTELQHAGVVSQNTEYEDLPRGRVVLNARTHRFIVYADTCILENSDIVRSILRDFCLPEDGTVLSSDEHYRCRMCLYGNAS